MSKLVPLSMFPSLFAGQLTALAVAWMPRVVALEVGARRAPAPPVDKVAPDHELPPPRRG